MTMDVLAMYMLCGESSAGIRTIPSRLLECEDRGVHKVKAAWHPDLGNDWVHNCAWKSQMHKAKTM
jgi:hypothetical protein